MIKAGRAALIAAVIVVSVTGFVRAAGDRAFTWRIAGGSCIPVNPEQLQDLYNTGLNLEAGLGLTFSHGIRVYGAYDYNSIFADEQAVTDFVASQDPSFDTSSTVDSNPARVQTAMALAVVELTRNVSAKPYLIGGVGWMWLSNGDITYTGGTLGGGTESGFATALGAGVDFRAGYTMNVFVEAVWIVGFTGDDATQVVPVRVGIYR
jgi:opacity protein-like surface antigen